MIIDGFYLLLKRYHNSTLRHQAVDVPGLYKFCRIFGYCKRLEVSFATLNLGAFLVAQVIHEMAALGFDDEIESLRSILFNQHGPNRLGEIHLMESTLNEFD